MVSTVVVDCVTVGWSGLVGSGMPEIGTCE
jgi:hypothetical protein